MRSRTQRAIWLGANLRLVLYTVGVRKEKLRIGRVSKKLGVTTQRVYALDMHLNPEIVIDEHGRRCRFYDPDVVAAYAEQRAERLARLEAEKHARDPYHFERCALQQVKRAVKRGPRG